MSDASDAQPTTATKSCTPLSQTSTAASRSKKTVYLVRHAESMENERVQAYARLQGALRRGDWPKSGDVVASLQLLKFDLDTPLSRRGERQLKDVRAQIEAASFVQQASPELLAVSPLQRAKRTAEMLFDTEVPRVEVMPCLVERSPLEALACTARFEDRVSGFKDWLGNIPQTRVIVVAHCQFFSQLLGKGCGYDRYLSNAEVKRCSFDPEMGVFEDLEVLFLPDEGSSDEQ